MPSFSGVVVAVITPFKRDYSVDIDAFRWLVEGLVEAGVDGLWIAGTTGEWPSLSIDERMKLIESTLEAVGGRVKIFAGVAGLNVDDAVSNARRIRDIDVDYIFSTPPLYFKPSKISLMKYYMRLAEASGKPVYIYTIPSNVGYNISPDLVEELALESSSIAGIKATVNDYIYIGDLIARIKPKRRDFTILVGSEELMLHTMSIGGDGAVSAIANLLPRLPVALRDSINKGMLDKAFQVNRLIIKVRSIIQEIGSPLPTTLKSLFSKLGAPIAPISRPPIEVETDVSKYAVELCRGFGEYLHPKLPCIDDRKYRIQYL